MLLASALGAGGFLWLVTGLITMLFPARRAAAWRMILAVLFTFALNDAVLKPLVDRPRPFVTDSTIAVIDARPVTGSFPSGHAAMSLAGTIAGVRIWPGSGWVWWPLVALVALSRVYIGVHWPTDVLGGLVLGLAASWFVLGGQPPRRPASKADSSSL